MSEQLRHKMIDFEATPPPAAWETIAARLEDDTRYAALAATMNHFEPAPPADSWKAIAARIEDDAQYATLATKMNHFDVPPPFNAWNHIAGSLQETEQDNIPVTAKPAIRRSIILRMAVAAALITVIIGAWMFFNRPTGNTLVKNNPVTPTSPVVVENNTSHTATDQPSRKETAAIISAPAQRTGRNQYAAARTTGHELKYAIVNSIPAFRNSPVVIPSSPILDENGVVIRDMDVLTTNSNYLIVMGPNGQTARISSKFANVIRYLNGTDNHDAEEYIDKVIKESDTWKKRFQEWRNKISQSSFIPSSANFLDIIEFKELIQEKQ